MTDSTCKAACEGKERFATWSLAHHVAKRKRGCEAYRCRFCGHWHIGRN